MKEGEPDFANQAIDRVKAVLSFPLAYLQLVYSLIRGALARPECREFLEETGDWLQKAGEAEIRAKAPRLWEQFDRLLQDAFSKAPPRKPWKEIAADYARLCKEKAFSWDTGLPAGWVADRFDCQSLGIWRDLPLHARIGIGHHAGMATVEEEFLLRDAFYLLVRARTTGDRLTTLADKAKALPSPDVAMGQLNVLKQNVCADCRLAVFSYYAFVECFVNSVGEDFIARNPGIPRQQQEILRGRKKGHYISTKKKIEKIAEIIRGDGTCPLILTDPTQLKEPFASFVRHIKELRDAAAHYGKTKAAIWLSPQKWMLLAQEACETCMEVARRFWQGCYPGRGMPEYLGWLETDCHLEVAEQRLAKENDEEWSN